jgi:hypothetical protein
LLIPEIVPSMSKTSRRIALACSDVMVKGWAVEAVEGN